MSPMPHHLEVGFVVRLEQSVGEILIQVRIVEEYCAKIRDFFITSVLLKGMKYQEVIRITLW